MWLAALQPNTKALFCGDDIAEPGRQRLRHPGGRAEIAHQHDTPLIVDSTFTTPHPAPSHRLWGADIVVHSATKFLGVTAPASVAWWWRQVPLTGATAGSRWSPTHLPRITVFLSRNVRHVRLPDETPGRNAARSGRGHEPFQRIPVLARPGDTPLAHGTARQNALGVARFCRHHPWWSGCDTPVWKAVGTITLAGKYLPRGAGAVFSFDIKGGRDAGTRFIESLQLWSHLANVGDAKSLVIHPASTTHRQLSDDELLAAGITAGTIRLSVGLETLDDLLWDLERGLQAATR